MSVTIWKFPLQVTREQTIQLEPAARILCVQMQDGVPCLWAMVDPEAQSFPRTIVCYGTGAHIREKNLLTYIDTVQDGPYVWHFFWRA